MTKPPSPRPLSVKVIAWGYLLFTAPLVRLIRADAVTLGIIFTGSAALFVRAVFIFLPLSLAVGLWYLKEIARRVAIGFACYELVNAAVVLVNVLHGRHSVTPIHSTVPGVVLAAVLQIFILWFLITRKAAFRKPTTRTSK